MHRTVSEGHAGAAGGGRLRRWLLAGLVGAVVVAAPAIGRALTVADPGTHQLLNSILAELKAQTQLLEQQRTTLEEIRQLDAEILAAICPSSRVTMVGNTAFDGDGFNIAATPLQLIDDDVSRLGYTIPSPNDVQGLQRMVQRVMGVAADLREVAEDPAGARARQMSVRLVKIVQQTREQAHVDAVRKALAFSAYSLNEGQGAKARETTLDQGRRSAGCLREDVTASHETNLELLRRVNHLITLDANASALQAIGEVRGLPVVAVPPEGGLPEAGQ